MFLYYEVRIYLKKGAKQEYPCPYFVQENFRGLGTR